MRNDSSPSRQRPDGEEPDQWLLDAARRAGHPLSDRERPAGTSAWRMLLSAGVPDDEVLRIACAASGTEPADFTQLSPSLASLLPHSVALKHRVAPCGVHRGTLSVATSNPQDAVLERDLAFAARQRVQLCAASPTDVIRAQGVVYGGAVYGTRGDAFAPPLAAPASPPPAPIRALSLQPPVAGPGDGPEGDDGAPSRATPTSATPIAAAPGASPSRSPRPPAPELTDRLLATACAERASDVMLDPTPDGGYLVRFGVDGTVNDRFRIPPAHAPRLLATLKQRAGLGASDAAQPQLGRTTFVAPAGPVTVRVGTQPVDDRRERVLLRLVAAADARALNELGYAPAEHRRLQELLGAASGLLVVAGPAGAGRTTTLYAVAREASAQGRAVSTVEDVVEYPLDGIDQTERSAASGVTLASAVRGVLASDGDVVIIGAPLDAATLDLCDARAERRRLVMASLDTPDLSSTIERLVQLHPDRAGLAPVLVGIVVQRLVRCLCASCAAPQVVSELPAPQQALLYGLPTARVRRPVGCPACRMTGYLGRTALAEVVGMTPELRRGITRGVSSSELARLAQRKPTTTLWHSGIDRVLEGVTSLAELLDTVTPPDVDDGGAPPQQQDIDALLAQLLGTPEKPARQPLPIDVVPEHDVDEAEDAPAAEEGAPSRATFTLLAHAEEDAAPPEQPPATSAPRAEPEIARTLRVLVVHDDAAARRALAQALTAAGLRVLQAATGDAALACIRRLRPDVVVTEVALPGLDAIGLLGALVGEPIAPAVIVHTEQCDDALDAWLGEAGARAVLRAGIPLDELIARIRAEARV